MSGTSADGIDAALVDFSHAKPRLLATHYSPYSASLREKILALCQPGENEIDRLGELDIILGKAFATIVNQLLEKQSFSASDIKAIGSHGQTIRHRPHLPHRFTLQIGDPNTIAAETGITTVADFRRKDIAYGGQGAPLVPAFHQHIFSSAKMNRVIVNIGGIANVTLLPKHSHESVTGFDTGPGNVLMDAWVHLHHQQNHDPNGSWAAKGKIHLDLLKQLLANPFFELPPPKSTGREHFNLLWLQNQLEKIESDISAGDVQATLVELTAQSIITAIKNHFSQGEILICGGGVHNHFLMNRLQNLAAPHFTVASTKDFGLDPDWVEATAFAWLAKQTMHHRPGNLPLVTGAAKEVILGGVYYAG